HRADLDRTEQCAESDVLIVADDVRVAVDDDAVRIDGALEVAHGQGADWLRHVETGDLRGKNRVKRFHFVGHGVSRTVGCCGQHSRWRSAPNHHTVTRGTTTR